MAVERVCLRCGTTTPVPEVLRDGPFRCPSCGVLVGPDGKALETEAAKPTTAAAVPRPSAAPPPPEHEGLHPCPHCGEEIATDATRCHFCGEDPRRPPQRPTHQQVRRDVAPHRGSFILVLGIISLIAGSTGMCAPIGAALGIWAWIIGKKDLQRIRKHELDPQGEGTTNAGRITGIVGAAIGTIMTLVFCLIYGLAFGTFFAARTYRVRPPVAPPSAPVTAPGKRLPGSRETPREQRPGPERESLPDKDGDRDEPLLDPLVPNPEKKSTRG